MAEASTTMMELGWDPGALAAFLLREGLSLPQH